MNIPLWRLSTLRRKLFEKFGSTVYSRPAYSNIDIELAKIIESPGYFVEAGAVDGVFESNTYYLEAFKGWTGVLIEPIPEMFARLAVNRPRSLCYNCALVSSDHDGSDVSMSPAHALSKVSISDISNQDELSIPARTLSSILDEAALPRIDLLSLDVEGFEIEVLKGLCFERHAPIFILIEALDQEMKNQITEFLSSRYEIFKELSYRDFLYKRISD
jgi:FkbM family methyltransferase